MSYNIKKGGSIILANKSDIVIDFNRYESVFYYETLGFYTPELKNLISKKPTTVNQLDLINDFFIVDNDTTCEKEANCKTLMDIKDELVNNNIDTVDAQKYSIEKGVGSYILRDIILKKIFNNSLFTLIKKDISNSLIIIPTNNKKSTLSKYLTNGTNLKNFYTNILTNDKPNINGKDYTNTILFNVFPENSTDDIETYTNQIKEEINKIKKEIIRRASAGKPDEVVSKLLYLVNSDNTMFTDFFNIQLKKKYADVLNKLFNEFYNTNIIEKQRINKYNTKVENLSKITREYIIKTLGTISITDIKTVISKENFKNKIALLLTILETLYKIRIDVNEKKKLSSSDNSTLFNIYMRFDNLDKPIITDEIIPSSNVLYILKSKDFVDRIGYFTIENKERNQYRFIINTLEYSRYKDTYKGNTSGPKREKWKKHIDSFKSSKSLIDEEESEIKEITDQEVNALHNKNINPEAIQKKSFLIEVRYTFGKIQYRDIQKKLNEPWNTENVITYYKSVNNYENYRFFNHRMIDTSFKDNINIKYYSNTLYDKTSFIEFLKNEKKYNEKTRLAYEFINVNLNNDLLLKYNNFIYDNYTSNIDKGIQKNITFEEQIKKNICDILFENSSLIYIRDTNNITNAPKEQAGSDNYKVINYKYKKIDGQNEEEKSKNIKEYFNNNVKELKKLKIDNSYIKDNTLIKLPDDLTFQIKNDKKTFSLAIVNITKELDTSSTGILFASECKSKKKQIKQGYYDVLRWLRGNSTNNYVGGSKRKNVTKRKKLSKRRIKYRHIYSLKYLKAY